MKSHALALGLARGAAGGSAPATRTATATEQRPRTRRRPKAQKAAGTKTIAAGLPPNSQFMAAAKAAGLDQTLAGPGPLHRVRPRRRRVRQGARRAPSTPSPKTAPQLTGVLTNLILPGTVLVADIDKAIDNGKGKALLATMGGGTLTATKDGGKTVLTDAAGHKATITQGDEQFTNGVVHHIDAVLMPSKQPRQRAGRRPEGRQVSRTSCVAQRSR